VRCDDAPSGEGTSAAAAAAVHTISIYSEKNTWIYYKIEEKKERRKKKKESYY
jgi:hypothetical protein